MGTVPFFLLRPTRRAGPRGFSLVEVLVVVSITSLVVGLLMPAVQAAREAGRRTQCANNMRQLALAAHNFHSAQGSFPPARLGHVDTGNSWGPIVRLLPFLEQKPLYNRIDFGTPVGDGANAAIGLAPLPVLLCPSDTNRLTDANDPLALAAWTKNSYRGNAGNDTGELDSAGMERNNGVFVANRRVSIDQIFDGTGNTALFSECVLGDGDDKMVSVPGDWFVISPASHRRADIYAAAVAVVPRAGANVQFSYSGSTYLTGNYSTSRYNHIMPPNKASVVVPMARSDLATSIDNGAQATTASSCHAGGVNLALADASVRFVRKDVDIQTWWALGSIAGGEVLQEEF